MCDGVGVDGQGNGQVVGDDVGAADDDETTAAYRAMRRRRRRGIMTLEVHMGVSEN